MGDVDAATERRFVFRDGALAAASPVMDARQRLLVADSFLVDDGRVRAVELHRARFIRSSIESGFTNRVLLEAFWQTAMEAIPPVHRWFPRVELTAVGSRHQLSLLMRLAPEPSGTLVVQSHGGADPRSIPSRKGPDLETLTDLRDQARGAGVSELVILDDDKHIIDGTTTAILWWRGAELHVPDARLTRVDSVTARTLVVLAQATGVTVTDELARPSDLAGCEVWAVNALYGVRLVTEWRGADGAAAGELPGLLVDPARSRAWQRRLELLARPLV